MFCKKDVPNPIQDGYFQGRSRTTGWGGGRQGRLPYESGGDARLKFWIKPLKETNLGVAQPFFDP